MSANYEFQNEIYPPSTSDPDNRDPTRMNKHLQLDFFHVIAEPDTSAYSFEFLHKAAHQVYHYSKICIYRLLTILLGLPLMLFWGLTFGIYTFLMIWMIVPMRRLGQTFISEMGVQIQTACDAIIAPIHRSMGQIFSSIRITLNKNDLHTAKQVQV